MLGSRILTKEWQALELGTLKELEHIMPSLLNTKHTSLAEMSDNEGRSKAWEDFYFLILSARHMVTKKLFWRET